MCNTWKLTHTLTINNILDSAAAMIPPATPTHGEGEEPATVTQTPSQTTPAPPAQAATPGSIQRRSARRTAASFPFK